MDIKRSFVPELRIETFADTHGLVMVVNERGSGHSPNSRFYAHFEHAEIGEDGMLLGAYGNGSTEAEAIANYAREISERTLVIDAMGPERREIRCPRFVG